MGIQTIKDSRGVEHLVFEKDSTPFSSIDSISEGGSSIGNKLDDFQILQFLGKGGFGFVAKVSSLKDNKVYALKQIDLSKQGSTKEIELTKNEIASLRELDHPNVNKLYHYFREDQFLYLVMEFMNNGDIEKYIKMRKELNMPIKEENLWNIFIQSMEGLAYIHSRGLIHRDIKPANLFMTNNGIIKIGDFGVSAYTKEKNSGNFSQEGMEVEISGDNFDPYNDKYMKHMCSGTKVGTPIFMGPEMLNDQYYDNKVDVYSMGVTFYQMCFYLPPKAVKYFNNGSVRMDKIPIRYNQNIYSKELTSIIDLMRIENPKERKSSQEILDILKDSYTKKYSQSTGVDSVIKCMSSFTRLSDYLLKPKQRTVLSNNARDKPICYNYLNCLQNIYNQQFLKLGLYISNIKQGLTKADSKFNNSDEINPKIVVSFLLDKLHQELNKASNQIDNSGSPYLVPQQAGNWNFNPADKTAMLMNYINFFRQNFKSAISDFFFGVMKTKKICQQCKSPIYAFNSYNMINFDLNSALKQNQQYQFFNLIDLFCIQNSNFIILGNDKYVNCNSCGRIQIHNEFKQFYSAPYNLVINFDRGPQCENRIEIKYDEQLEMNGQIETKMEKPYQLVGVIKRCDRNNKEHYVSICFNNKKKIWILTDGNNVEVIESPKNFTEGIVISLYYQLYL